MPKLILERFKCIDDTSEISPTESPYFMIYVAEARNGSAKSDVKFVRRQAWDNAFEEGDTLVANITVSSGMHHDLVIAGMLEEDWNPDMGPAVRGMIAENMKELDSRLAAATKGIGEALANTVRERFRDELEKFILNDEILGVKRVKPSQRKVNFTGDGGNYEVRFKFE